MPKFKLYATVTEEWVTEIDAEDRDQIEELVNAPSHRHLVWKPSDWDGDFSIYDVVEMNDNNPKGEK